MAALDLRQMRVTSDAMARIVIGIEYHRIRPVISESCRILKAIYHADSVGADMLSMPMQAARHSVLESYGLVHLKTGDGCSYRRYYLCVAFVRLLA